MLGKAFRELRRRRQQIRRSSCAAAHSIGQIRRGVESTYSAGQRWQLAAEVTSMKFYKYWAKANNEALSSGTPWKIQRYGASNTSAADAQAKAQELARQTADGVRSGDFPGGYLYSDRPVREEIVESFGEESNPYAVITRNAYGSLVLNTAQVLFADIDDPPEEEGNANPLKPLLGMIGSFLGAPELTGEILGEEESGDVPTRVAEFVEKSPGLGLSISKAIRSTSSSVRCRSVFVQG
jgi:hypothetical protein